MARKHPEVDAAGAAPKKKRGGCLKWALIGLGIIIVIAIISSLFGGGTDGTNDSASNDASTSTSQDNTNDAGTAEEQDNTNDAGTAEEQDTAPAEDDVPADHKNALRQGQNYASVMNMSKQGVYDQLVSEYGGQFSPEAAQYAIDNLDVDWNANALKKAEDYQETMAMSPEAIRDQLTSEYGEKFTAEEADYAIQNLNK